MVKHLLIFIFILQLGISGFAQNKSADSLDDAESSSEGLNFPSRRSIDGGLIVLGIGSYLVTRIKPQTPAVLEARHTVQEIRARLWREAPEMAAAREKYQQVHELRTLEETAEQRKAWE